MWEFNMVQTIALCILGYIGMIMVSISYISTYQKEIEFWKSNCYDLQERYNRLLNDTEKQ